jgi:thiamine transport system permease protein
VDTDRAALTPTRNRAGILLALAPLSVVAVLVGVPLLTLVISGLRLDAGDPGRFLSAAATWRVLGYTIGQAILSTALSIALALPAAYALRRLRWPGRRTWLAILTVPFVLPTVVVGLAFRELLPFAGTTAAIIVAHVFFNVGLATRVIGGVWAHLDPRYTEVALSLGAGPLRAFRSVTWPFLRPAVFASAALVFLFTFTSFGVVLIVGDPAWPTIEVEIYRLAVQSLNLSAAASLAVIQLVIVVIALGLSAALQRRTTHERIVTEPPVASRPRSVGDYAAVVFTLLLVIAVCLPLLRLAIGSIRVGDRFGWDFYVEVFAPSDLTTRATPAWAALATSARYALIATAIAAILGMLGAIAVSRLRRNATWIDTAITLPLGVSAVSLGLGLLLFSIYGPIDLRGSWMLVPLGQALVAMPIVIRVVLPVLRSIDPRLRDVAATLGAGPVRAWVSVDGPIALRVGAVAAGLAAAVSLGEFGATAFLVRSDTPTVPVQIVRLLGRPGEANLGQALALSVILVIVTGIIIGLAERARPSRGGGW